MTKKEYCDELVNLLNSGLLAEREGRIADKVSFFARHDAMVENPQFYIDDFS